MSLTFAQKQQLFKEGWTHIPGVVPRHMIDAVLRAINHSLGEGIDPNKLTEFRDITACPELRSDPVILDLLFATPAWGLIESALGEVEKPPIAQIALRFPELADPPAPPHAHIDGTYREEAGHIGNFTMLAGIMLSDVSCEDAGNFTVWPGAHHDVERYAQENGARIMANGTPPISLPPAHQVMGQAGDMVMAHFMLPHAAASNASPLVRYAIFFRIHYAEESGKWEAMTNIWRDWPGLGDVVRQAPTGLI